MLPAPREPVPTSVDWVPQSAYGNYENFERFERFRLDQEYWSLYHDEARWERPENVRMIDASMSKNR